MLYWFRRAPPFSSFTGVLIRWQLYQKLSVGIHIGRFYQRSQRMLHCLSPRTLSGCSQWACSSGSLCEHTQRPCSIGVFTRQSRRVVPSGYHQERSLGTSVGCGQYGLSSVAFSLAMSIWVLRHAVLFDLPWACSAGNSRCGCSSG